MGLAATCCHGSNGSGTVQLAVMAAQSGSDSVAFRAGLDQRRKTAQKDGGHLAVTISGRA